MKKLIYFLLLISFSVNAQRILVNGHSQDPLGPELMPTLADGQGWLKVSENGTNTITFSGGIMSFTGDSSTTMQLRSPNVLTIGVEYEITVITDAFTSGGAVLRTLCLDQTYNVSTGVGPLTFRGEASKAFFDLLRSGATTFDIDISTISVKEVL